MTDIRLKAILLGAALTLVAGAAARAADDKDAKSETRVEKRVQVIGPMVMVGHGPDALDFGKDGGVTKEQFLAAQEKAFARLDRNGDGRLTRDELEAPLILDAGKDEKGERTVRIVKHVQNGGGEGLDRNGDGKVSFEEFCAPLREAFEAADKDRSGFLEKGETAGERRIEIRQSIRHEADPTPGK